jgi:hypothetical protein
LLTVYAAITACLKHATATAATVYLPCWVGKRIFYAHLLSLVELPAHESRLYLSSSGSEHQRRVRAICAQNRALSGSEHGGDPGA